MSDTKIEIFTDGACKGNPGPGGWGALLKYGDKEKEINGFNSSTTNNIMELTAVIEALKNPKRKVIRVFLTEDSKKQIHRENSHLNLLKNMRMKIFTTKLHLIRYSRQMYLFFETL